MKEYIFGEKRFRCFFTVLVVGATLANIKSIFNDYDVDAGYAVAVAYRLAYIMLTGTVTGIVLYLQTAGIVIRGLFVILYYKSMKPFVRKDMLMFMCLFFFSTAPKGLPIPEFSNMQVWFAVGLICFLVGYLNEQEKKYRLVRAGFVKQLNRPMAIIGRFLFVAVAREHLRLPCVKGAVTEAD